MKYFNIFSCLTIFLSASVHSADVKSTVEPASTISVIGYKNLKGESYTIPVRHHSPLQSSISEVLSSEAGVHILHYGAPGGYSSVRIRAASQSQTDLYIDGIKMDDLYSGSFNAENFSLLMFREIEIYRSYPLSMGGTSTGGAINLIPQKSNHKESGNVLYRLSTDTLISGAVDITLSHKNLVQFFHFSASKNEYQYTDENGTLFYNHNDDFDEIRKNEDYIKTEYSGYYNIPLINNQWKFFWDLFYKESGLPGQTGDLLKMRMEESRILSVIQNDYLLSQKFFLVSKISVLHNYSRTSDPEQSIYVNQNDNTRNGISLLARETLGYLHAFQSLKQSIGYKKEHLSYNGEIYEIEDLYKDYSNREYFIYSGEYSFTKKEFPVHFFTGYNLQYIEEGSSIAEGHKKDSGYLYGANGHIHLFPFTCKDGCGFYLFTGMHYSERIPSFSEKYGNGAFILSNPELEEESSLEYSGGMDASFYWVDPVFLQSIGLRSEAFSKNISNFIMFIPNSQNTIRAINTELAEIQGIENSFKAAFLRYWSLFLNYSYMRAIDRSSLPAYDGKHLPQIPRYFLSTTVEYNRIRWKAQMQYRFHGATFRDRYNSIYYYIESKNIIDVSFTWKILPESKHYLSLSVKNLLNEQKKDVLGYPIPGRYYTISLSGSF